MSIDSYQPGDRLTYEDFHDEYYMPRGKYDYCEVVEVDDENVSLLFIGVEDEVEDPMTVSRDQMARMLGWEDDLSLGADDVQTKVLEEQLEALETGGDVSVDSPDGSVETIEDEEVEGILSAPAQEISDAGELLDTDGLSEKGAWVETDGGFASRLHLFASKRAAAEDYHANSR